jgi:TolB-like protein
MSEESSLRRLLGTALICSSLAFATAASPTPAPAGRPTATATPAATPAAIEQMPVLVVYPFEVQTGVDPRLGIAIAQILGQEMIAAGGITVLPVPLGIKRADFLETARADRADFYISGYVTPVGDSAAVVEQVVSVSSGVILFSQTAQVSSVADVASQSLLARSQILAFVGRNTENVQTQPANTPAPTSTNGAAVPIQGLGSIVSSVFKHKGGSHAPSPAPVVKPARGVIVAPVSASGVVAPADLANALRELYFALNARFNAQMTAITSNAAQSADQICGPNRDNTIATGTLQESPAHHGKRQVTFDLSVYTCFGAILGRASGKGSSIKSAVDSAVAAYATAHPENS